MRRVSHWIFPTYHSCAELHPIRLRHWSNNRTLGWTTNIVIPLMRILRNGNFKGMRISLEMEVLESLKRHLHDTQLLKLLSSIEKLCMCVNKPFHEGLEASWNETVRLMLGAW